MSTRHSKNSAPRLPKLYPGDTGYVYVMQLVGFNSVKIGWSTAPLARLKTMQTGAPDRIRVLAWLPGLPKLERLLHKAFAAQRHNGEWFKIEDKLEWWIVNDFAF